MSNTVDNRIVSLEFDNSRYDKNVNQSIKTTDKLKSALKFQDVETGFERINKAITRVTFAPMEKGVETVYAKFTMLERFIIQAYDRIANKIIDTGKRIANEMFVMPRTAGFELYQDQVDSTKVLLESTQEPLSKVTEALRDLNEYANQTIYSFSDMTSSIGKFTNNGVLLEDAVMAIKGISNEAALAGANTQQASSAMYNFSQALGVGYLGLIDWRSIENAMMGTKGFKNELIDTAVELGTLTEVSEHVGKTVDGTTVSFENFRDTLQDKWLTKDVLLKTLQKYGDESTELGQNAKKAAAEVRTFKKMIDALKESLQTGWAQTWEILFGNIQEATLFWSAINDVLSNFIDNLAKTRNSLLQTWKDTGGRAAALNGIVNVFRALANILGAIKEAFRTVFPPLTGERLTEFSIMFEKLTRKMAPTTETIDKIKRTFTGFFSVFGMVSDTGKAFIRALFPTIDIIKDIGGGILDMSASLGDWLTNLRKTAKEGKVFETVFGGVSKGLKVVTNAIKMTVNFIKELILAFKEKGFIGAFDVIKAAFTNLISHFTKQVDSFNPIDRFRQVGKNISKTVEDWPVIGTVSKFLISLKNTFASSSVFKFVKALFLDLVAGVKTAIEGFRGIKLDATDDFTEKLKKKFEPIYNIFNGLKQFLSSLFNFIKSLLKFIGVVTIQLFDVLSAVFDSLSIGMADMSLGDAGLAFAAGSLGALLITITKGLGSISGVLANVNRITASIASAFNALTTAINAEAIKKIAHSIAILTVSLLVLSALPIDKLSAATAVITALFANLIMAMRSYTRGLTATSSLSISGSGVAAEGAGATIASMGAQLFLIASAIAVLVGAIAVISMLNYESLVKGVAVLELLLYTIADVAKKIGHGETVVGDGRTMSISALKMGGNIFALGFAINVIVNALIKLMIAIAILNKVTDYEGGELLVKAGEALGVIMLGVSAMIWIIEKGAVTKDSKKMGSFTAGFTAIIFAVTFMITNIVGSLIALTAAIAFLFMNELDDALWEAQETMTKLAVALTAFLVGFMLLLRSMFNSSAKGINGAAMAKALGGTVAIMAMIALLFAELVAAIIAVTLVSAIPNSEFWAVAEFIEHILIAVAAILAIITMYARIAKDEDKANPIKSMAYTLVAFAAALSLLGLAFKAFEGVSVKGILKGAASLLILLLIFMAMAVLAERFDTVAKGLKHIGNIVTAIAAAVGILALAFLAMAAALKIMSTFTEEELDAAIENLETFLENMQSLTPEFAETIATVLAGILETVLLSLFNMLLTQMQTFMDFLLHVLSTLVEYAPDILENIWNLVDSILESIERRAPDVIDRLVLALISVIRGLAKAIEEHKEEIVDAVNSLFEAVVAVLLTSFGKLRNKEGKELDKFVEAWKKPLAKILKSVVALTVAIKAALKAKAIYSSLGALMGNLAYLPGMIQDAGGVWSFFSQRASYAIGSVRAKVAELSTFTKYALVGSILVAIALAVASIIRKATDAMEVCETMTNEFKEANDEIAELNKDNLEKINDIQKSYKDIDLDYNNAEEYLSKLKQCVDTNGKIKEGMEDQANFYATKLNDLSGLRVDIESGMLTVWDLENEKIDLQSAKLEDLMAKRKLFSKLEAKSDDIEELRKEVDPTNKDSSYLKAIQDAQEQMKNASNDVEVRAASEEYAKALENYNVAKAEVEAYDEAEKAYLDGDIEKIRKANVSLNRGFVETTDNAYAVVKGIRDINDQKDTLQAALDAGTMSSKEFDKKMEELNGELSTYIGILDQIAKRNPDELFYKEYDPFSQRAVTDRAYGAGSLAAMARGDFTSYSKAEQDYMSSQTNLQGLYNKVQRMAQSGDITEDFLFAVDELPQELKDILIKENPELEDAFEMLGKQGANGVIEGMHSRSQAVHAQSMSLAELLIETFRKELRVESPSKELYEIGDFTILGFLNALKAGEDKIKTAAQNISSTVLTAFSTDLGSSPMIQPVIGAPAIGNTWSDFQTLASGIFPLSSNLSATLADGIDISPIVKVNEDLLNTVTLLRDDMAAMHADMTNLKVVMNADALVGQIVAPMDTALGLRAGIKALGG